jgi:membrane protease YdiL (CAAX protease family)
MSISIADASVTTLPSSAGPVTSPAKGNSELIFFWICVAWAILGMVAARGLRAFRRQSIVGPVRVDTLEQAGYLFFIGFFGYLMAILAGSVFASRTSLPDDLKQQVLQVLIFATLCIGILCTLAIVQPNSLLRLGLNPLWIPAGLIGGAATLFIVYPLIQITGDLVLWVQELLHQPQPQAHELLLFLGKNHNPWWRTLGVFSAVIVAPMTEELLFRGLIQTTLGRVFTWAGRPAMLPVLPLADEDSALLHYRSAPPERPPVNPGPGPRWAAVIVTAAIFAAIHMSVPFFLPLFVLAVALGYVYERTGNLWMSIATHSLFNTGQILLFLAASRGS